MRQGLAATPSPFSSLPGSAEALRQPRLRETKLAQHRGLVPLLPAFGHPAVENAIEDEPLHPNRLAGRWRAGERASVRALGNQSCGNPLPAVDVVLDGEVKIRERCEHRTQHLFER